MSAKLMHHFDRSRKITLPFWMQAAMRTQEALNKSYAKRDYIIYTDSSRSVAMNITFLGDVKSSFPISILLGSRYLLDKKLHVTSVH